VSSFSQPKKSPFVTFLWKKHLLGQTFPFLIIVQFKKGNGGVFYVSIKNTTWLFVKKQNILSILPF